MGKKIALLLIAFWTVDGFASYSMTPYAKKGYNNPPPWLSQRINRTC